MTTAVKTATMAIRSAELGRISFSCVSWLIYKKTTAIGVVVRYPGRAA